jgi:vitamin B12 transporter
MKQKNTHTTVAANTVKNYSKKKLMLFLLVLLSAIANSQTSLSDTLISIDEIKITSVRLKDFSVGNKVIEIDSSTHSRYYHRNISDVLSEESSIFIKSYGMGSLATSSFRGGSSSHTALLWNNFTINSPMNGIIDLALLPVSFFNNLQIQHGGSSSLWGSGALGGSIHLNNQAKYNAGISASANVTAGSFGNFSQQGSINFSKPKSVSSINILHQKANNDFQYTNIYSPQQEKRRQNHAELLNYGIMANQHVLLGKKQQLNASLWIQHTDRNLPPTLLQTKSEASQNDQNYRASAEWSHQGTKTKTFIRGAYFNETILYNDSAANIFERNNAQSYIAEAENKLTITKNHAFNFGINNTYYISETGGYPESPTQNRSAIFASYLFTGNKQNTLLSIATRQEFIDKSAVPFTGSVSFEQKIIPTISFKANVARVYRVPTFNDLFWQPGGNPDLLSENGFTQDVGILFHQKNNEKIQYSSEFTVFNRNIRDWIVWLPGTNFWTPRNIMKVWSRGLENVSSFKYTQNKFYCQFNTSLIYVASTNREAKSTNDASLNKQLIYVPKFNGFIKAEFGYSNFSIAYRHNYSSQRFTSTDNSEFLPAFHLGAIYVSYHVHSTNSSVRLFAEIQNLWNVEYQTIRNRPMPPTYFIAGFSFSFLNSKNKFS